LEVIDIIKVILKKQILLGLWDENCFLNIINFLKTQVKY